MTQTPDKQDEQWLNGVAGQPDPEADPALNRQAEALRRALKLRQERLDASVPPADAAQHEQLVFRLRREGLMTRHSLWHDPKLWGIAATLVLGIGIVVQQGLFQGYDDESSTLRGGGNATVLIVADPEVRLTELLAGLRAAGAEPSVKRGASGSIVLSVKGSTAVLDYLAGQRIEPTLTNGMITLSLQAVKGK